MDGSGNRTARRVLVAAICIATLAALAFISLRSDPRVVDPSPAPVAETEPVRAPRARAPEPAPLPPRAIRVAVTSMDGTPIPGARVELVRGPVGDSRFGDDAPPSVDAPKPERAAIAGDDGAATVGNVPPGRWFVVGSAPGFARHVLLGVTRDEGDAPVDASVVLEKGSAFAGTIRDPDGAPASGVDVVLAPWSQWPNDPERLRTKTDASGSYRFDAVEAGSYVLWCSVRPGFLTEAARVMVPSLDGLDIRMVRGAAIEGVVRDAESGAAIAGARVFAVRDVESRSSADPGSTTVFDVGTTDHLGRFSLHTWRQQFELTRLVVDAPGYVPTPVDDSGRGPPGAVADGQRFVFDLRVRRAATLKGTVSTADGPLAGFLIRVRPKDDDEARVPQSGMWDCTTGADGSFVVDRLPAGPADVSILEPATGWFSGEGREVDVVLGDTAVHEFRIDVRRVRVTRRIVNTADEPVDGAEVLQRFGRLRAEARTDADGRFTMDAMFEGSWSFVEVRSGRIRGTAIVHCDDEEGETLTLSSIPANPWATGKLVGQDGSPAAGERLDLWSGLQGIDSSVTTWTGLGESISAADGTFRIPLPSGPDFNVTVHRLGWFEGENEDDGSIRITLPAPVRVAGLVVAADDSRPIVDALIRFHDDTVVARAATDGRFAFSWTPPSGGPLQLTSDGWLPAPVASGGDDQRVELRRARAVAGTVRNPDGSPARGLRVVVRASGHTSERVDWRSTSATDADGRFVVPGLAAGPCVVTVTDPVHFAFATVRKTTTAGDEAVALVVRPGARLEVVVMADGKPVAGARVTAHPLNADLADDEARTAYHGTVEFGLADAAYTLRVEHDDFATVEVPAVRAPCEPQCIVLAKKQPR